MRVNLAHPITVAGRKVDAVDVRPPGRNVFALMQPAFARGVTDDEVARFIGRLSGLSVAAVRKLDRADLERAKNALVGEYRQASRRLGARHDGTPQ